MQYVPLFDELCRTETFPLIAEVLDLPANPTVNGGSHGLKRCKTDEGACVK
ncbi:MAG: hypothetical protein ACK5NE_06110 [Brachymonas sp.]